MDSTVIICFFLLLAVIFALRSACRRVSRGCCGGSGGQESRVPVTDRNRSHYPYKKRIAVEGMTCKNCAAHVENAFNKQTGFYAKANLEKGSLTLLSKAPVDDSMIRRTVASAGYLAREIVTIS